MAFQKLKAALTAQPVLKAPDFEQEFLVQTDASENGLGIVLSQVGADGEEHPVLFLSKKLNETEKRYGTTEKECLALVWGIKKLHCYLDGKRRFRIQTDHNPLVWLQTAALSNPRVMRWAVILQNYNFEIEHRKGNMNANADALSRSIK